MDSQTFDKAVAKAAEFKAEHDERFRGVEAGAELVADELAKSDPRVLAHNVGVLIDRPENPASAFNVLNTLSQRLLREHRAFPPALATWAADVLAGTITRPKAGAQHTVVRDCIIVLCVRTLRDYYHLKPTRNEATEGTLSACDATAKAWDMKAGTVADIWGTRTR